MTNDYDYMKLPYDLSGSMSKNRFRNEMLWGMKKIFELHKTGKDYVVVFDYACDIEVHLNEKYEFYQVKTQNNNEPYKMTTLIRKSKGRSILGKLYILKYNQLNIECENENVKIAVVSNAPLNDGKKTHKNCEELELLSIDQGAVDGIKKALKSELNKEDVNLENAYFVRTGLDLFNPEKTLIGETSLFFEEVYSSEAKKVNSLYRVLVSEIYNKASYELEISNYKDLLMKKGITRSYLANLLDKYVEKTDSAVEKAKEYINQLYKDNFGKRIKLNKILSEIITELKGNKWLKNMETEIANYIYQNLEQLSGSEYDIIEQICRFFDNNRPIEVTLDHIWILVLLTMKRFEEGVYEHFND